jgi:hypothetical protein
MLFNKRRVGRDKLMIKDLEEYVADAPIFIEPYSEELFSDVSLNIILSEKPLEFAEEGDFVFVERQKPSRFAERADEIVIYKWNRRYPFDFAMDFSPEALGFKLESSKDFKGYAHEKITREVYRR